MRVPTIALPKCYMQVAITCFHMFRLHHIDVLSFRRHSSIVGVLGGVGVVTVEFAGFHLDTFLIGSPAILRFYVTSCRHAGATVLPLNAIESLDKLVPIVTTLS